MTTLTPVAPTARKRAVSLLLNEQLLAQAEPLTDNLSTTVEELLGAYVQEEQQKRQEAIDQANACVDRWNRVHARIGSYADQATAT